MAAVATVASDWVLGLDPVAFAAAAGYADLDDWQQTILRKKPRRLLLNASRQCGKTLCVALLATHQAIYRERSLTVAVAVAQRQAAELVRTCRDIYVAVGRPEPAVSENKLSLELHNKSRILAVPSTEATIRGLSHVDLLILDEASRVPDATYRAVLPFLATSDGKLALLSTPAGRRGFFYQAFVERDQWHYVEVPGVACTRIPATFLVEQRRKMSQDLYAQEWENAFNSSERGAFREEDIDRAVRSYTTWNLRQYEPGAAAHSQQEQEQQEVSPRWNLSQYRIS